MEQALKKTGIIAKVFDHIFFLRPLLLLPIWAPLFLGYTAAGGSGLEFIVVKLLALGFFLGGGIYGLNQIYDIEGDRINKKNLPLSLNLVSKHAAWAITIFCDIAAIAAGIWTGFFPAIFTTIGVVLGVLYSHPKFRFKDHPWLALVLNAIGHGALVYVIGWSAINVLKWEILYRMLPYAVAYAGVYVATTIPDLAGDRLVGKNTLAVAKGEKKASIIALALIGIASIGSIFLKEPAIFLTGLFSAPFYVYATVKSGNRFVSANKIAVLLLNLWVCFYAVSYTHLRAHET